jgi:hypothetical protein
MNYRTFRITRIAPDMWVVADPNTNEVLWNGPTRAAGKRFVDLVFVEMGKSLNKALYKRNPNDVGARSPKAATVDPVQARGGADQPLSAGNSRL